MSEVRVYPMLIEVSDRPTCGLPRLAVGADARRILERVKRDSEQFGTNVRLEGDLGVIRLSDVVAAP